MKLWLLRPVDGLEDNDDPWNPWYDRSFGFVVRAETEEKARALAHDAGGQENGETTERPWMDAKYTSCVELLPEGPAEVIMADVANGW